MSGVVRLTGVRMWAEATSIKRFSRGWFRLSTTEHIDLRIHKSAIDPTDERRWWRCRRSGAPFDGNVAVVRAAYEAAVDCATAQVVGGVKMVPPEAVSDKPRVNVHARAGRARYVTGIAPTTRTGTGLLRGAPTKGPR